MGMCFLRWTGCLGFYEYLVRRDASEGRRELGQAAIPDGQILFRKSLSNSCRNLALRHLVNCFNANNASTKSFTRKTFFQLVLCFAGAEDKNRFCAAKMRDHLIIVSVEMAGKLLVSLVIRFFISANPEPGAVDVLGRS